MTFKLVATVDLENEVNATVRSTNQQPTSNFPERLKFEMNYLANQKFTVRMKKSILTIENSKALNYVFATIFKPEFGVIVANNYSEAFQYLRSGQFVDLIIINIPNEESDNFRFLAHLSSSSLFYSIPTVVLSDSTDSELRNKTKALGASLFLNTPFDPVHLIEKVKEFVYEKESRTFIKEIQ
jgi:two-component system chemotaxis response regulator CheY